jgi:hypothetical protein
MAKSATQTIKDAPVTTLTTIESVVGFVLTFLVTHHIVGNIDVSTMTQTIAPFIALAIPAIFGSAKWRLVSPAEKVKDLAERDGVISDADIARIEQLIDERLDVVIGHGRHHDDDEPRPRHLPRPAGMAAGRVDGNLALNGRH